MRSIQIIREISPLGVASPPSPPRGITDSEYLLRVIRRLGRARIAMNLTLEEAARRAKVKPSVIDLAEQNCRIPTCREFKAWAAALGFRWEQLWSECCPVL